MSGIRILKSIGKQFMIQGGIEVCRGYMRERLRLVKPQDLYKAIKESTHTLSVTEDRDRNFGKKWSRIIERLKFDGKQLSRTQLTAENVLEWLKADRPDLASLIMNMGPEGMNWLREDVKQVYAFLFPPEQKPSLALTLVKREQPKKEEPSKVELEQGAEDAGVHATPQDSEQKTEAESSEKEEKQP